MRRLSQLAATFLMLFASAAPAFAQGQVKRPNIIVIVTDDQDPFSLAAYGNTVCQTPNLDRLARAGMTLDRAYHMGAWSGAVCQPSRTMVMTGRTVWHLPLQSGGWIVPELAGPADIADQTLASVFNRAGYDTFRTCKRGNSYEPANVQFTTRVDATKRGGTPETGSAWHGDAAIQFLDDRAQRDDGKPFLMYLGFSHPHDPRDGPPELVEKYGATNTDEPPTAVNPEAPSLPINYLPEHPFPNPHGHTAIRDESQVPGVLESRSEATIRNELGRYYACIENLDLQIGRVLRKLEDQGELDHTYVFFTSDHGIALGGHGLQGKQNLYERSWRVPMIVMGPGIKPGSRAPGNVYLLDILATLCDLASVTAPATNEGLSFAPVLLGTRDTVRDVLFGVYAGGSKPGMRSIRAGDWKMIKIDAFGGQLRRTQLFNLAENPHELMAEHHDPAVVALTGNTPHPEQVDLADDPRHAEKRAELERLLFQQMRLHDDPFLMWDQPVGVAMGPSAQDHL